MQDKDIVRKLIELYGEHILPIKKLPSAYCPGGISNVKAIYLGCDPSNIHSTELPYAFAHECKLNIFKSFISSHSEQLNQIGLDWNHVYAQNLCRNYFIDETSKNSIWKTVAEEFWIEKLNEELAQFDSRIPVLLTSQILLKVLGTEGYENILAPDFYECKQPIPIPANKNKINRELVPVYRGKSPRFKVSYHLKNVRWNLYRNSIIQYFEKEIDGKLMQVKVER